MISTNVFLVPPPRGGSDMFSNLLGSLFGGGGPSAPAIGSR